MIDVCSPPVMAAGSFCRVILSRKTTSNFSCITCTWNFHLNDRHASQPPLCQQRWPQHDEAFCGEDLEGSSTESKELKSETPLNCESQDRGVYPSLFSAFSLPPAPLCSRLFDLRASVTVQPNGSCRGVARYRK